MREKMIISILVILSLLGIMVCSCNNTEDTLSPAEYYDVLLFYDFVTV